MSQFPRRRAYHVGMKIAVISCSLNAESRSAGLAERLRHTLEERGVGVEWIDLRDLDLPLCDGSSVYSQPRVQQLGRQIAEADAALLVVPIYNYDVNAAAKNMIELTGKAWLNKVVGFACSAGGRGSFMSVMALANSLMLDFRCHIVPRFVYADDGDFDDGGMSATVAERLEGLATQTAALAEALGGIAAVRP
jgi:FMN reductase